LGFEQGGTIVPWWGWLALGAALLAAELGITADFWLAVVGAAAFGPALMGLVGIDSPIWVQWLVFGVLTVVLAVFVRGPAYRKLMAGAEDMEPELLGEQARATGTIAPGEIGEVKLRGSVWRARNDGNRAIAEGSMAQVDGVDGVVLRVRPV
jgi:membrane protein implicated in regulation of membrane protease activity